MTRDYQTTQGAARDHVNSLIAQAAIAGGRPYSGEAHYKGWDKLLGRWAAFNGLKRSAREVKLDALKRGLRTGGAWGEYYNWPDEGRELCDHPSAFRRDGVAAAIISEPYPTNDFHALLAYADKLGLVAHSPPNPKASFWFPGWTYLVVLTMPSFGEVRWLHDQITFAGLPRDGDDGLPPAAEEST
jgi:hypothetical protein